MRFRWLELAAGAAAEPFDVRVAIYGFKLCGGADVSTAVFRVKDATGLVLSRLHAGVGGTAVDPIDGNGGYVEAATVGEDGIFVVLTGTAPVAAILVRCGDDPASP